MVSQTALLSRANEHVDYRTSCKLLQRRRWPSRSTKSTICVRYTSLFDLLLDRQRLAVGSSWPTTWPAIHSAAKNPSLLETVNSARTFHFFRRRNISKHGMNRNLSENLKTVNSFIFFREFLKMQTSKHNVFLPSALTKSCDRLKKCLTGTE